MRGLFGKIFLWFWLGMLALAGVFLSFGFLAQSGVYFAYWRHVTGNAFIVFGQAALDRLEEEGPSALADTMDRLEAATGIHFYLFNAQGRELLGRDRDGEVGELLSRAGGKGRISLVFSGITPFGIQRITRPGRPEYILVGRMPFGALTRQMLKAEGRGVPLLVAFLLSAAICYGLAVYLTRPIRRLREAIRQISEGNLRVRVAPKLGKRRDEIASLGRDFDRMTVRLDGMITAQRRLIRDVSHELRSPLTRMNVGLELARHRSGPEAKNALERIEREAGRLSEMVGQLLTLARLEGDPESLEKRRVDLEALLDEIVEDVDFEARARDRTVRVTRRTPCVMLGTREILRSAVENVVRNAARYTDVGTEVKVELLCEGEEGESVAVIRIHDRGPGVPESALKDLFRPFYRIDEARDRKTGGTGIGLALTERAVELHEGTVVARNAQDGGLVVEIRLPAVPTPREE